MHMKQSDSAIFEQQQTVDSWDEDYYNPISNRYYDEAIATMLRLMEPEPGATVLDAGCGPGVHSVRVAGAGYRVCAIDVSKTMLQEARRRAATAGLASSIDFREEDLIRLTFPNHAFRYVFSWGVIIHIHDVEKALDELARVVAPGGKLALYVTNKDAWDYKLEALIRFVLRKPLPDLETRLLGNGIWYEMHGQKLWVWLFDVEELARQMEKRGLHLTNRLTGEFSEFQRHVNGPLRRLLLRLNNFFYRIKLPPGPAIANLLVFHKKD